MITLFILSIGLRLKDESAPPSHHIIYPLDQEELPKHKKVDRRYVK